ncbi:MAG: hypothetical protein PWQ77_1508 [Kosmotogales bacterium]|nr:hypothetical protein [Kosmotogales bacterium]
MLTLTIFHDGQYWVGMMEENNRSSIKAFKKVFGMRPSDKEILDFINSEFFMFFKKMECSLKTGISKKLSRNPKKRVKQINKEKKNTARLSKAFAAVKLDQEKRKTIRKDSYKEDKKILERKKYERKLEVRREKHRGH